MPQAAPFILAGGAALTLAGGIASARAQKRTGEEDRQLAIKRAGLLVEETEFNQISLRREIAALIGQTITAYSGGGVVASTGSAADVRFDNVIFGDKVALFDRYQGLEEADIVRQGGDFAAAQGRRASRGTLLSTIGRTLRAASEIEF